MKKETIGEFFKFLEKKENTPFPFSLYGNLTEVPEEMEIWDLDLFDYDLTSLGLQQYYFPKNLKVKKDFRLLTDLFEKLPETILAGGHISLTRVKPQHILPNQIEASSVSFSESTLKILSPDIKTRSYLNIENSKIMNITGKLEIEGILFCGNTPLSRLYSRKEIKELIEMRGGYVKKVETSIDSVNE